VNKKRCAAGGQPDYHCQVPQGRTVDDTIPTNDKGKLLKCSMYVTPGNNETTECSDWQYSGDIGHTIVSQVVPLYCHDSNTNSIRYH